MSAAQALTPFARKLAETMFCIRPSKTVKWAGQPIINKEKGCDLVIELPDPRHGWTQADHEAILDRPRVVEPSKPFIRGFGE